MDKLKKLNNHPSHKIWRYLILIVFLIICFAGAVWMYWQIKIINYNIEQTISILNTPALQTSISRNSSSKNKTITLPILLYHHISRTETQNSYNVQPEIFEQQMAWIKANNYNVITLSQAVDGMTGVIALPENPLVITFDDGVNDEYVNAFPILEKYGFSATFYIKINIYNTPSGMTTKQLKELKDAGMEIASHSVNHDDLTKLSSEQLKTELTQSKAILEKDLDIKIRSFAYPGGAFNDTVIDAVIDAGYGNATTTAHSIKQSPTDLFRLNRSHIDDDLDNLIKRVRGEMP